jgi:hypothetical protein
MKNKANKMKLVHESDYRVMQRQGFWLPFLLLIGGIYLFIKFASYNYEYTQIQGELESYKITDAIYLKLKEDTSSYRIVGNKINKVKVFFPPELSVNNVKQIENKSKNYEMVLLIGQNNIIVQMKMNDQILLKKQKRWKIYIAPVIMILVSLILIPFVIKARRKNAEYFGDDKLFGKEKFKR